MYTLALQRELHAQHFLIGGDWGPENRPHFHHYRIELRLEGDALDEHGYLVDLMDVEARLNDLLGRFEGTTLNDHPLFAGVNPSIERFSRILCEELSDQIRAQNLSAITVRVWENENAWAAFRKALPR